MRKRKPIALVATAALMLIAATPAFAQDDFQNTNTNSAREANHIEAQLADEYSDIGFGPDIQYPSGNVFVTNWR